MRSASLIFTILFLSAQSVSFAQSRAMPDLKVEDGVFHLAIFGFYSSGSLISFSNYAEGTLGNPTVNPGKAKFQTGSFYGYGAELMFFTEPFSGFSFGYVKDSPREVQYRQVTYDSTNATTRVDYYPRNIMDNESYLFNYYLIRTPGRGYISFGVNYSNPKWADGTASSDKVTVSGDLGLQASMGISMVKGFIFDLTVRSTGVKLKRETTDGSNTFTDYGSGQSGAAQVGFKLIF